MIRDEMIMVVVVKSVFSIVSYKKVLPISDVGPWNESQLSYFITSTGLLFENVAGMRLEDIVGAVSGPDYSHVINVVIHRS